MFNDDNDYIFQDFLSAREGTSSDLCHVLRKMLLRGVSEANFRHRISEGDKALFYKGLSLELEDAMEDLDGMIDLNGKIIRAYRLRIMRSIKSCQCLLAIDQVETNADYSNLEDYLTGDLSVKLREELMAA